MVSARRAARMSQPASSSDEPPEWLWRFSPSAWVNEQADSGEDATIAAMVAARRRWREARDAWLEERGLVMWGMGGLPWHEFKRIEQQEPHRILRRPGC